VYQNYTSHFYVKTRPTRVNITEHLGEMHRQGNVTSIDELGVGVVVRVLK